MIDLMTSFIDLILIWAVSIALNKKSWVKYIVTYKAHKLSPKVEGKLDKFVASAKIAEKFAERAFTVANAASLGVIALQKSLAVPRIMTKEQAQKNQLAKSNIDKLFTTQGQFDFLRPVLSDEDNALLDDIEEHNAKQNGIS